MNLCAERIERLRALMGERHLDAVIIPGSDPHKSEYFAPRWKGIQWLTGFTGEAGDVVVTATHAGLWTDSRYFIQAAQELDGSGVQLHKLGAEGTLSIPAWLCETFSGGGGIRLATSGDCQSVAFIKDLQARLGAAFGSDSSEIILSGDILDSLWDDRPAIPESDIITLDEEEVGWTRLEKIAWIRRFMEKQKGCAAILLSSLDQIAWMLNVRGSDIDYNPYVISYLLITGDRVLWFVSKSEVEEESETADSFALLASQGIEIKAYDGLFSELYDLADEGLGGKVFVDLDSLNAQVYATLTDALGEDGILAGISPVILRKACKHPKEIEGFRHVFFEDGIAVERYLYWLETALKEGRSVTEREGADKLESFRAQIEGYRGNSFGTISAWGPGAALPHYATPEENAPVIQPRGLYLVDSGGQYFYGTTDITRTVPVGECTDLEKEDYTLVLKAMINLSMTVFPEGTCGIQLDALARTHLWRSRRNFGHGTGHGVGFLSGVHEGPQSFRPTNRVALREGMVTSNEPGLYREGMHGIRHENIVLCVGAGENEFGKWMRFETLTCCHFDTSILRLDLLSPEEIAWLNEYNESVYQRLAERLETCEGPAMRAWLRGKTRPVGPHD
ncbi:MAG: aminopeptidase P family protein [Bacteroidales bacterium]|nr:aminopeptidase P family protein [Bacteroidales bacterium]